MNYRNKFDIKDQWKFMFDRFDRQSWLAMPGKGKGRDKSVPIKSQQEVIGFLDKGLFSFLNLLDFHLLSALLFRGSSHGSYLCCALLATNTADTFQAILRNAIDHQFKEEPDSK